jgi:hypothetical protein
MARSRFPAIAAVLFGCHVADVDLTGHPCPCVDESWVCSQPKGVCVRGAVSLSSLQVAWTTPNNMGWTWKAEGLDNLAAYELGIGPTLEDVQARTSKTRTWTAKENPELAFSFLPRSTVADPVLQTMTDEHAPNTTYFGKLFAIDKSGVSSSTAPASGSTTPPAGARIVLYSDDLLPGSFPLPTSLTPRCISPPEGFNGSACALEFDGACDDIAFDAGATGTTCGENLRVGGLGLPLSELSDTNFEHLAFVEFAIAVDPPPQSFWSNVWLAFGQVNEACTYCWGFSPWTVRADGQYRRVQVPLRVFTAISNPEKRLTRADFGAGLTQFAIGGTWSRGAKVRLDEVSIRW